MMLRTLALAFSLTLLAAPAFAEDFTFVVPVDVRNLPPEINRMNVGCSTQVLPGSASPARMVGAGLVDVTVSGGSYRGDVTVAFNATRAGDAGAANGYSCTINSFSITGPGGRVFYTDSRDRLFPLNPTATYRPYVADVRITR